MLQRIRAAARIFQDGPFVGRSLVGDIESEYDEFDIDVELDGGQAGVRSGYGSAV